MKGFWTAVFFIAVLSNYISPVRAEDPAAPVPDAAAAGADADADQPALEDDADLLLDDAEYSYGTVNSISDTELAMVEYDYDTGEDVTVSYTLDPKVELDGVASVKDIAAKDNIEVDYLVKDGKKVAIALYVEKPLAEAPQT